MKIQLQTYHSGDSYFHCIDVRVRLFALVVYCAVLLLVDSWVALAMCAVLLAVIVCTGDIPVRSVFLLAAPVYVLAACVVMANAVGFDFASAELMVFQEGFARSLHAAIRIVLLVWASLVVCLTASAVQFADAFRSLLSPLRAWHVPVDDVAMVFSVALRFLPLVGEELLRIRAAQWVRGASFGEGSPLERMKAWMSVLVPLIAGLFRRADNLATAMDARCYGASEVRTSLKSRRTR